MPEDLYVPGGGGQTSSANQQTPLESRSQDRLKVQEVRGLKHLERGNDLDSQEYFKKMQRNTGQIKSNPEMSRWRK